MSQDAALRFPSTVFPQEARHQRLLGIYPMRQEGLFMQRVKAPGGRISLTQWRKVAELAKEHTPPYPLLLTTRQDIELHGLRPEQIVSVQEALHSAGLTTERTCGDTVRNVVCCPGSGLCSAGVDVLPLAAALDAACEAQGHVRTLPRKFKFSLSGCGKACARPWIQDLGLIAEPDKTFRVIVAGSLGARPGTGIECPRRLKLDEVIPFAMAALKLFNEEGDRQVRTRARWRHVRERLGNEAFLARLEAAFQQEVHRGGAPTPPQPFPAEGQALRAHLRPPLGDLTPDQALAVAQAAETAQAQIRIGLDHDLRLYGYKPVALPESLAAFVQAPSVIACPGTTWCSRGIADARRAAGQIRNRLSGQAEIHVSLSGCPNNCAQSAVAHVGLVGCVKTINSVRTECFRLLAGGGLGTNPALGRELHPAIPADQVAKAVDWLAREHAGQHESFENFVTQERDRLARALAEIIGA